MRRGGCLSAIEMLEFQAATGDSWDAFDKRRTYCQYSKGNEHLVLVGAKSPATIAATVLEAAQQRAALKRDGHTERSLVPQTARRGRKTGPRALS